MEDLFRGIAIGLGVLLGTFHQGVQPELHLVVHKTADQIVVSATVDEAVSSAMEEALAEGVPMMLTLTARIEGRPGTSATRTLAALPLTKEWQVTASDSPVRAFRTLALAKEAWVTWDERGLGQPPSGAFAVSAEVILTFPGRPDWKADMVWKTASVAWRKAYNRLSEIPF